MELDDHVCLCFHVSKRKLRNFIRIERPRKPAQLSECFGAGTGCGWCRPFLRQLFAEMAETSAPESESGPENQKDIDAMTAAEYAAQRSKYVKEGGGKPPPGAAPV